MKISEISPQSLKDVSDQELLSLHLRLHQLWGSLATDSPTKETVSNAHEFIVREMLKRGIRHQGKYKLEKINELQHQFFDALSEIDDLIVIPDFASLTGSSLVSAEANDLDIVWRAEFSEDGKAILPLREILMKFERAFPKELQDRMHQFGSPQGPTWTYAPIADLVMRFKEPKVVELDESYAYYKIGNKYKLHLMKPFTPLKAVSGYHRNEYFVGDEDKLFEWVKGYLDQGKRVVAQPKFDGIRLVWHKRGNRVAAFTEDKKRDRASVLPQVTKAIRKLKQDELILDTEAVIWRNGKPIKREEMMAIVVGKKPIKEEIHINVHDVLWYNNEKDLSDLTYKERLKYLDKVLPSDKPPLYKSPSWFISDRKSFDAALKKAKAYSGSEGSMLKSENSRYQLSPARTVDWAKYKVVKEIAVQIIGIMKKAMPFHSINIKAPTMNIEGEGAVRLYKRLTEKSKTYLFRVAFKNGKKLQPMDEQRKLTESDFHLKYNAKLSKPKWQGLSDPKIWKMDKAFEERKPGDWAYGSTYAASFDKEPKLGDIITVSPVQIIKWDGRYSWMFPRVKGLKPEAVGPDNINEVNL